MSKPKIYIYGRYMGDIQAIHKVLDSTEKYDIYFNYYNSDVRSSNPPREVDYIITSNCDPKGIKGKNIHVGHGAGCIAKLYHSRSDEYLKDYGKYYAISFCGKRIAQPHIDFAAW